MVTPLLGRHEVDAVQPRSIRHGCWRFHAAVQLLVLLCTLDTSFVTADPDAKKYLIPIMPYGPCNQIASLKEVMVLGKLLGRTVVVHKLFNHWTDAKYHKVRLIRPNIGATGEHRTIHQQQQQQPQQQSGVPGVANVGRAMHHQRALAGTDLGGEPTILPFEAGLLVESPFEASVLDNVQTVQQHLHQQLEQQQAAKRQQPHVKHIKAALSHEGVSAVLYQQQRQQQKQQHLEAVLSHEGVRTMLHRRRGLNEAGGGAHRASHHHGGVDPSTVVQQLLDFDEMYNRQVLASYSDVTTFDEFRRDTRWDGKLEALLYSNSRHLPQMERSEILYRIDISKAAYLHVVAPFNCSASSIVLLRAWLERYDVVAALLYEEVVPNSGHNVRLYRTGDVCHDEYLNVSAKLVKSDSVVAWADGFIAEHVGTNRTFVAVHIRPYPDSCLLLWEAPESTLTLEATTRAKCTNRNLYRIAADHTAEHMVRLNTSVLFVVAHPLIRAKVNRMYAGVGIRPVYYDMGDLEAQPGGRRCVTLLSMVEAEVAVRAAVFLGTPQSSMSGMIMQERAARGMDKTSTLFFPKTT